MVRSRYIWAVSLDENLKTIWERLIPVTEKSGPDPEAVGRIQETGNPGIVFTVKLFGKTKIIDMDLAGNVRNQNTINGPFTIIHPSHPATDVHLISSDTSSGGDAAQPITLLTLNEKLEEIARVSDDAPPIVTRLAFQAPDRSLLLFGSRYDNASYYAKVFRFDPSLKHRETIDFSPTATSWRVDAAVATDSSGGFACVRSATTPESSNANIVSRGGSMLAFIRSGVQ
jgi:hypothetical protein